MGNEKISVWCPNLEDCHSGRVNDAEHRGKVLEKLVSLEHFISVMHKEMIVNRSDVKGLYFRVGLISGGASLIVSLGISIISKTL